jgi:hypothetical protein
MTLSRPVCRLTLLIILGTFSFAAVSVPAFASHGGPGLAEPLGWDPRSKEVYFRILHADESGDAPSILRVSLDDSVGRFETLPWAKRANQDSTYELRLDQLQRKLRPLQEIRETTIPAVQQVLVLDSLERCGQMWPRYRVRVRWFNGACEGWVEAITYRDPSVRMIRLYRIPDRNDLIGVFSCLGIPCETGYEVQMPALLPRRWGSIVALGQAIEQ